MKDVSKSEELKNVLTSWLAWDDWNEAQRETLNDIIVVLEAVECLANLSRIYR